MPIKMLIPHNFLRVVRKRTQLTQIDIASILRLPDIANVSRWEQGLKRPGVEVLLAYHLLFNVPIEALFERQKHELRQILIPRVHDRIAHLKTLGNDPKVTSRMAFLASVSDRLTA
jgi:transcriptional regulator with XRE-family HTH domain